MSQGEGDCYARGVLYVTVETIVRRRPEVVWDALTDIASLSAWVEGMVHAKAEGDVGVGTEVHVTRRTGPRGELVRAACEITRWRPPSLLVVETRAPGVLLLDRVTLEPVPHGTMLRFDAELMYSNKLAEAAVSPAFLGARGEHPAQGIYDRSVEALVKRIETSAAVPYR